ncbi:phage replisome organizer N-terminal domain-containing protein [Edaphobacillus lindanitolerans]|uniref:Phage replisome organizer, putative, N-terminal region n=1 Tax=Edaphobacillus lindanitolerans TaxID=550447 RepID=A0A1U7PT65_9BACI|nr:phage replisome organizer N-terminal domain-containing protein [Edaphobacillus lindanitolerans]SIT91544.1 phage replisome organizer, putative, N-terminal region/phage conserved hypothetical protein, C-terminal domain-containing protein [Edaphobacillus lindanitolerans]
MSDVKWIKLSTQMFEDEKIRLIEQMPDADTILIIWVKLLSQAGKTNANGYIYLSENIPYTDEMLATIFNRPLSTVRLALKVFSDFGMIECDDEQFISITNWGKHQSLQGLEKVREQTRERVARHREKKRLEEQKRNVTLHGNGAVTHIEEELELDIDKEEEIKDSVPYRDIVAYFNEKTGREFKSTSKETQRLIKARWNDGFRLEDFKKVIDIKSAQWLGNSKMENFLRPKTLFSNNFESYLQERVISDAEHQRHHGRPARTSYEDELAAAERAKQAWGGV